MKPLCLHPALETHLRDHAWPIMITGASGWLGLAVLEMLDMALGAALHRRVVAFSTTPRVLTLRSGRSLATQAFATLDHLSAPPGLIFHFAFVTRGHVGQDGYVAANRGITRTMRGFLERNGAQGIVIPSSGAVYGPGGVLDSDVATNPYGVLKHEDELIFGALSERLAFPAAILRIFNLAGPFINNLSGYALASIIGDVLRGGPVTLRAAQPVLRSYTHVADVINIAVSIIVRGLSLPVFDTAGELEIEIGELASRVGRLVAGREVATVRPAWRDSVENRYVGDFASYRRAAARAGVRLRTLDRQILDTAAYMASLTQG